MMNHRRKAAKQKSAGFFRGAWFLQTKPAHQGDWLLGLLKVGKLGKGKGKAGKRIM